MKKYKQLPSIRNYKSNTVVLILFLVMCGTSLQGQEPSSYQWKNRIILILVDNVSDDVYKTEIAELNAHRVGLDERKFLTYHIQPSRYKIGLKGQRWQQSEKLYHQYKKTNAPFEIILVGLDGGVKLRRTSFVSCKTLFETIDAMPMRIREKH